MVVPVPLRDTSTDPLYKLLKSGGRFSIKAVIASIFSGEPTWRAIAACSALMAASMGLR